MPERALFDVCVHGQPISAQTGQRHLLHAWKQQVAETCVKVWNQAPLSGNLRLRVVYYGESRRLDWDNLVKPIQDALQSILYHNDRQIIEGSGRWEDINARRSVRYIPAPLAMAFSDGRPFVHIAVWRDSDRE